MVCFRLYSKENMERRLLVTNTHLQMPSGIIMEDTWIKNVPKQCKWSGSFVSAFILSLKYRPAFQHQLLHIHLF